MSAMNFHLVLKSTNGKVGPIPVSTSTAITCPDACPLKRAADSNGNYVSGGCYADGGPLAIHWRKVTGGERGTDWRGFVSAIAMLPPGTLWRHNQAGDLPGANDAIDGAALAQLVDANTGKNGFTYTHKPMADAANRDAVAHANANGFVVNLSANTLAEADALADMAIGPVVVLLDAKDGERADTVTPAGRKVATCPATYRDDVTCASCKLCARRDRKVIVGFPAHGTFTKKAATIARGAA